jgi:hypothetical protein
MIVPRRNSADVGTAILKLALNASLLKLAVVAIVALFAPVGLIALLAFWYQ